MWIGVSKILVLVVVFWGILGNRGFQKLLKCLKVSRYQQQHSSVLQWLQAQQIAILHKGKSPSNHISVVTIEELLLSSSSYKKRWMASELTQTSRSLPITLMTFLSSAEDDLPHSNNNKLDQYVINQIGDHIMDSLYDKIARKSPLPLSTSVYQRQGFVMDTIEDIERYLVRNVIEQQQRELTIALYLVPKHGIHEGNIMSDIKNVSESTQPRICERRIYRNPFKDNNNDRNDEHMINEVKLLPSSEFHSVEKSCNFYYESANNNNVLIVASEVEIITNQLGDTMLQPVKGFLSINKIIQRFIKKRLHLLSVEDIVMKVIPNSGDVQSLIAATNTSSIALMEKKLNKALLLYSQLEEIFQNIKQLQELFVSMDILKWLLVPEQLLDRFIHITEQWSVMEDRINSLEHVEIQEHNQSKLAIKLDENIEFEWFLSDYATAFVKDMDEVSIIEESRKLQEDAVKYLLARVPWQQYFIIFGPYWLPLVVPIVRFVKALLCI